LAEREVAIARFSNETTYGAGLFTDEHGDRLGKQAADILARHLTATQHFQVLERQDLGKLQAEAKLMGMSDEQFRKNLIGVDALILGSLVELGRETTGGLWLVGKKKTQRARARVVLRLVDPRTGAVFYTTEGAGDATLETSSTLGFGGAAGWDSTLEGKAIDAAIVNMMNNVVATLDAYAGAHTSADR
jgi:curli biogenesis system outer membrane secretion channel CsgG